MSSEDGHGTSFRVALPAAPVTPAAAPASPAPAPTPSGPIGRGDGELILVVDDEAPILRVVCLTLETFGYRTLSAADGAAGLLTYQENRAAIRLVITALVMPNMDGPALIAALKELDPALRIIATTGMASEESLAVVICPGVARILPKPCSAQTILQTLRAELDKA